MRRINQGSRQIEQFFNAFIHLVAFTVLSPHHHGLCSQFFSRRINLQVIRPVNPTEAFCFGIFFLPLCDCGFIPCFSTITRNLNLCDPCTSTSFTNSNSFNRDYWMLLSAFNYFTFSGLCNHSIEDVAHWSRIF